MQDSFEEQYLDVLQNIEFAITSTYREHPELTDASVDQVLDGLMRHYRRSSGEGGGARAHAAVVTARAGAARAGADDVRVAAGQAETGCG